MSAIRRERITVEAMEPLVSGGYRETRRDGYAWMCPGCGRVWARRWYAETCVTRGHVDSFPQTYGVRAWVNGHPVGNIYTLTRRCMRRENLRTTVDNEHTRTNPVS